MAARSSACSGRCRSRVRRRGVATSVRRTGLSARGTCSRHQDACSCSMALALWVWHVPALYDYAVEHEGVHVLQHLCFFGTATLFWWGITHGTAGPRRLRRRGRLRVPHVPCTAAVLGALLTVSPDVWYAPYLLTPGRAHTARRSTARRPPDVGACGPRLRRRRTLPVRGLAAPVGPTVALCSCAAAPALISTRIS